MSDNRRINSVDFFLPKIQITFHTVNGTFNLKGVQKVDSIEDDIVACQTFKDINQPAGMFTIMLVDRKRYDRLINPMDVVSIQIGSHITSNPKLQNYTKKQGITHASMIGLVDTVHRVQTMSEDGKPRVYCEIKGRDFGKLLIKHQVRYLPFLVGNEGTARMFNAIKAVNTWLFSGLGMGGLVSTLLGINFRRLLTESVNLQMELNGDTTDIRKIFATRFSTNMGYFANDLNVMSQEGTLWDIMKNYANLPWNEMWVDTIESPELAIPDSICDTGASSPTTEEQQANARSQLASQWDSLKGYDYKPSGYDKPKTIRDQYLTERMAEFGLTDINQTGKDVPLKATRLLHDMRIDNSNVILMARQTPFDNTRWEMLRGSRCYNICNDDIREKDIGIGDHEVFSYHYTVPLMSLADEPEMLGIGVNPVLFSRNCQPNLALDANRSIGFEFNEKGLPITPNAVEKYGFLPLELQTRIWAMTDVVPDDLELKTMMNQFILAIVNWNRWNAQLYNGTITLKGSPDIHVGDMLYNADEDMEFYVESVANTYTQYGLMITTLYVTRGQYRHGNGNPFPIDWGDVLKDIKAIDYQGYNVQEKNTTTPKTVDRQVKNDE